jgi:hypothetical protein
MYKFDRCDYIAPESLSCTSLVFLFGDFAIYYDGNTYPIRKDNVSPELRAMDYYELMRALGVMWEVNYEGRRLLITRACQGAAEALVEAGLPILSDEFSALASAQKPKCKILKLIHNEDKSISVTLIDRES